MNLSAVFAMIDDRKEEYYSLLERICNIESGSSDFEGVRAVNSALCGFARERGFSIRIQEYENAGACALISMNDDAQQPALMFSGHMDTVFARGDFGTPPCRRDGDILYGPGTYDCKGGVVTALLAMDALKAAGFTDRPIRLFLQCDEEVSSSCSGEQSIRWMVEEARRCAAFLNCESGLPGKLTVRRKGILKAVISVSGKSAHAKDYFDGASAAVEAAYKITRLHEKSVPGGVTFNCTIDSPAFAGNIVPDRCNIHVDVRVSTEKEADEASAFLHEVARSCRVDGARGEITEEAFRPPMEANQRNQALFEKINRICARRGLPGYLPNFSGGGSDAADVSAAGVPSIDSLGIEGDHMHTTREYCRLSSMEERARLLAAIAVDFDAE